MLGPRGFIGQPLILNCSSPFVPFTPFLRSSAVETETITIALVQERLGLAFGKAKQIVGLIEGTIDPSTFASVQAWVKQCYNEPSQPEQVMCALDEILETFGVEAVTVEGAWVDRFHGNIVATYCNSGDTYDATVVYDSEAGEYLITSWGDFLEDWEQRHAHDDESDVDDLTEHEDFAHDNDY